MDPSLQRCTFFVQRKKRYCKMLARPGQEVCAEHQKPSDASEVNKSDSSSRIVCPLDRKHTVYAHKLDKHLKICNAKQKPLDIFIQPSINSGASEGVTLVDDSFRMLSTFPKQDVMEVIRKVMDIYSNSVIISEKLCEFQAIEEEMTKPEYGDKTKKHLKQASAILGLLQDYNMLQDRTIFIEFGAGRGQLSCWIAGATEHLSQSKILLIERASPKHKRDNKLAKTSDRIRRIKADIADLVLDKLISVSEIDNIVGVTKHLCGEATDLAIRCMTNPHLQTAKISGLLLTFCCHHRCRWTPFTGKQFFQDNGLSMEDFSIMCGLSSWATCGTGYSREYREKLKCDGAFEEEKDAEYGLSRGERAEIGRKCKNIFNWARLKYLESRNIDCKLHYYVSKDITLENVCIVGQKRNVTNINIDI